MSNPETILPSSFAPILSYGTCYQSQHDIDYKTANAHVADNLQFIKTMNVRQTSFSN